MRGMMVLAAALFAAGLGTGCADGMSEEEAKVAMSATANALSDGTTAADTKADVIADYEHGCAGGGAMTLAGDMAGIYVGFDVGVKMTTCQRDGVTMDGELTYTMVSVNALAVKTLTYSYAGTITYGGDAVGTCDVAMTGTVTEVAGSIGVATWAGKMCDYDGDTVMAGVDIRL